MKVDAQAFTLLLTSYLLISGLRVHAVPYDHSVTTECRVEPQREQYGGGIIVNPGFDQSLRGWAVNGKGVMEERVSKEGKNRFIVARNRTHPLDSFSQRIRLEKGKLYSFSAWVQLSEGTETVSVVIRTNRSELVRGGHVTARHGCWTLLKGGLAANFSSIAEILFESKNTEAELWVDSVSLQPFTKTEWRSHQDYNIERVRKRNVRFQIMHTNETALEGTTVLINQTRSGFPFGCSINHNILTSKDYQTWFASRFKYTTFTNEMKWYSTEIKQGEENYTIADAMLEFTKQHDIAVRGHNIFWDNPTQQPQWVKCLSSEELRKAAEKRLNSVVSRYKGELIAWDVVNENLHFSFFEDKLGKNASVEYYSKAFKLDQKPIMFMNEYNAIEYSGDKAVVPEKYKKKLEEILSYPGSEGMPVGIGLQGHFVSGQPNLAYMRCVLDSLATAKLPIWLTEVSVDKGPNQADHLEEIMREAYAHPAVEGIITFSGPAIAGFKDMQLVDENFHNTPVGDVVDKLLNEWKSGSVQVKADSRGFVEVSLFHGDYDVTVIHPVTKSSTKLNLSVKKHAPQEIVQLHL